MSIVSLLYTNNKHSVIKSEVKILKNKNEADEFIIEKYYELCKYPLFFESKEKFIEYTQLKLNRHIFKDNPFRNAASAYQLNHPYLFINLIINRYSTNSEKAEEAIELEKQIERHKKENQEKNYESNKLDSESENDSDYYKSE